MRRILVLLGVLLLGGGALLAETEPSGPVLMLAGCAVLAVAFLTTKAEGALRDAAERRERAAGIRAAERVLAVQRTGRSRNDVPLSEVTLLVGVPGRATYRATVITSTGEYVKEGRVTPVTV